MKPRKRAPHHRQGLAAGALLWPLLASAAAITDGSTGAVQSLAGSFTVPQALGTLRGSNLFHSFSRFSIATGESATFSTRDAGIRHVISRVTGGEASSFNGPLTLSAADGSSPSFWFVNPSGITVGAGAAFNVPGSLHLSSAPQLQFADGAVWDARSASGSTLTVAAPERFGFLGGSAAAALRWQDTSLALNAGSTLGLSGGSVTIERSLVGAPEGRVQVQSPGAVTVADQARLYALPGPTEGSGGIRIDAGSLTLDGKGQFLTGLVVQALPGSVARGDAIDVRVAGPLLLTGGGDMSVINASDAPGGRLRITADSLTVDGLGLARTGISSAATGAGTGSAIDIDVNGAALFRRGGQVYTATNAGGHSGALTLRAGSLTLDAQGGFAFVGTQSLDEATGGAGALDVRVRQAFTALAGGVITSSASDAGAAGAIRVDAGSVRLDGLGSGLDTGVQSLGAGALQLNVAGPLDILNGAAVFSLGWAQHPRQPVQVQAHTATLVGDRDYLSTINSTTQGALPSAAVQLTVTGDLVLRDGGLISSSTSGTGAAGALTVRAGSILADSPALGQPTGLLTLGGNGGAGRVDVQVAGALTLLNSASISSSTAGSGEPGPLQVRAGSMTLDGGTTAAAFIGSLSSDTATAAAAHVDIEVSGAAVLRFGGQIDAATLGPGAAGHVRLKAGTLLAEGSSARTDVTSISSSSLASNGGRTGDVSVEADQITLLGTANIAASTLSNRVDDRSVTVSANRITVDGRGLVGGIRSFAFGDTGNAGTVRVRARDELSLRDGGSLMAGTLGQGDPGLIDVQTGTLLIDGSGASQTLTGISGSTIRGNQIGGGAGAALNIHATRIELREGGIIATDTATPAHAGAIRIVADSLHLDGGGNAKAATGISADTSGPGRAGSIDLQLRSVTVDNEAVISSSSAGPGHGGTITIQAQQLTLDRNAGLFTFASDSGSAGNVVLRVADAMVIGGGAGVAANTASTGAAGRIDVQAGSLQVGGTSASGDLHSRIVSRATPGSAGRAGNISIDVRDGLTLQPGALLSIANESLSADPAATAPSALVVRAGSVTGCSADVTAAASGSAGAGAIQLLARDGLRLTDSTVRTTAVNGDGGPITLSAGGTVWLQNARVTTSVEGLANGNGGDIAISGNALLMASGFVQANTAAARARGGDVQVAVGLLVPNGSNVFLGGSRIEDFRAGVAGYNVIQAAAPEGLSGTLNVTLPQLSLSGSLAGLQTQRVDFGPLGRDLCDVGEASSLGVQGRGALAVPASGPLGIRP